MQNIFVYLHLSSIIQAICDSCFSMLLLPMIRYRYISTNVMCVTEIYNVKEKVMLDLQDLNKVVQLRKNAFD